MENNMIVPENQVRAQDNRQKGTEIDIIGILNVWKRHISLIALVAVIGGLIGYAVTLFFTNPRYRATATMFIVSPSNNAVVDLSYLNLGKTLSADYTELMKSRAMLDRVIEYTGEPVSSGQLAGMTSISSVTNSHIMSITVTSGSPQQAMRLANGFVMTATTFLPEVMGVKDNYPRELDLAMLPTSPYNMNYLQNIGIGMAVGALIVMAIYALIFTFNDTFNNAGDIEKYFGIPPLAAIPENNQKRSRGGRYYYYANKSDSGSKKSGGKKSSGKKKR